MKKTIDDYGTSILQLHVDLQRLPACHPDYEKTQDRLSRQLSAWAGKLNITIHAASNEQTGWTAEEMGYPVLPMSTKKDSGARQVADYQAFLNDYNMFCGVCVERKGTTRKNGRMDGCDLYSSFAKKDNRRRFYAEVERFKLDSRFDQFVLIAECSRGEYLSFKPAFNRKNYNKCNYGMNVPARRATLAKLMAMGVYVDFAGTRAEAIESYRNLIVQWCRTHYQKILNIE